MLQKVEITDGGDTTLLPGEQLDREEMDEINAKLEQGPAARRRQAGPARHHQGEPADPQLHLGGLVPGDHPRAHRGRGRRARRTRSIGLKENVIVGRLIPAGTGAGMNRLRVAATSRDAALRAQQRALAGSADRAPTRRPRSMPPSWPRARKRRSATIRWRRWSQSGHGTDADAGEYLQASPPERPSTEQAAPRRSMRSAPHAEGSRRASSSSCSHCCLPPLIGMREALPSLVTPARR